MSIIIYSSLFALLPSIFLAYYTCAASGLNRTTIFFVSPWPVIIASYALTFVLRPWLILNHGADTLDYETITEGDWQVVYGMAVLSILAILGGYFIAKNRRFKSSVEISKSIPISLRRIYLLLSLIIFISIFIYGSALANTQDRLENSGEYTFYFLFIVLFKLHYLLTVLLYSYLSRGKFDDKSLAIILLVIAPILQILVSGRGAGLFLLVSLFCVHVVSKKINLRISRILLVLLGIILLSLINYILSFVRVVISAKDWSVQDLYSLFDFEMVQQFDVVQFLILFSWDYSLFDVCVRIINQAETYMFGVTNFSYILAYIPRLIWPSKPYDQGYMLAVTDTFYNKIFETTGSTFSGMLVGEGYWNFGLIGVLVYSFIFGYVVFASMYKAIRCQDIYSVSAFAIMLPLSFQMTRGGLDVVVQFVIMTLIPLYTLRYIFRR